MTAKNKYQNILTSYPEYVTKEQMYQICCISKKTCLYLLESGLVPCIDSGKQTRRFCIKTTDIITYLQKRDQCPSLYRPPAGYYGTKKAIRGSRLSIVNIPQIRIFYSNLLTDYPDVLSSADVCSFTGYKNTSVVGWCKNGHLKSFLIKQRLQIPKEYLLDFLLSDYFSSIAVQSQRHRWFNEQIRTIIGTTQRHEKRE